MKCIYCGAGSQTEEYCRICGADLCGEPAEATEDSRKCNELFIELLRNCKKLDFPPGIG